MTDALPQDIPQAEVPVDPDLLQDQGRVRLEEELDKGWTPPEPPALKEVYGA